MSFPVAKTSTFWIVEIASATHIVANITDVIASPLPFWTASAAICTVNGTSIINALLTTPYHILRLLSLPIRKARKAPDSVSIAQRVRSN